MLSKFSQCFATCGAHSMHSSDNQHNRVLFNTDSLHTHPSQPSHQCEVSRSQVSGHRSSTQSGCRVMRADSCRYSNNYVVKDGRNKSM